MNILMIEDDEDTVEVIRLTLGELDPGSSIKSTWKGGEGLELAKTGQFDVLVLDLGLPDMDGIEVLQKLRSFSHTPVLIVSARHDPDVVARALELGAQDYILKPFKLLTFLASLKETAEQSTPLQTNGALIRISQNLSVDTLTGKLIKDGIEEQLTPEEWKVLHHFLERRGRIVTVRELALKLSLQGNSAESEVHAIVNRLRKKLGDDVFNPKMIVAEYECGYRFSKPGFDI